MGYARTASAVRNAAEAALRRLSGAVDQRGQLYLVLLAAIIGLLGGLGAVLFRELIDLVNVVGWGEGPVSLARLRDLPLAWKVLVPAGGGLLVGAITQRFARETRGHGVPEVMEAVALRGGRIRPRVALAKMLASAISIGSGGSVGREGPIVQIGSAVGSTVGQWLKVDETRLRTLVGCGAAAGIAATFNAPVAGALFALEVVLGDFGVVYFAPIVISSVAATVVSRHYLGDSPAFLVPAYGLVDASELLAYAGLGVLAAFVAVAFIRTLYAAEDGFERLRLPPLLTPVLGGALIGVLGSFTPQIFGVGYEAIDAALHGQLTWQFMALLVVLKLIAVSITIGSGGSGGIFAPSLFIGAMLGGGVGALIASFWPTPTAGQGAYALVGMAAVVGATTHAPLTAILIIFELTGSYEVILPLMISAIIATLLATRIQKASIYTLKLLRRGVDLQRGRAVNVLQHVPVEAVMRDSVLEVKPSDGLVMLISRLMNHSGSTLFVTDERNRLEGVITAEQIRPALDDPGALDGLVIAEDVMVAGRYPKVAPNDSAAEVMRLLGTYRGEIPVLENERLVGAIWPEDVIQRYNDEVFKRDMAGGMSVMLAEEPGIGSLPAVHDVVVAEIPAPPTFVGRSMRELHVRQSFGASVLMIKRVSEEGDAALDTAPSPDYVFRTGDVLLVLCPAEDLPFLRSGRPPEGP